MLHVPFDGEMWHYTGHSVCESTEEIYWTQTYMLSRAIIGTSKGPGHILPILGAKLPYLGPRRAFAHFVSMSLSSQKIAYLQERDGMPIIAPRVLDLSM